MLYTELTSPAVAAAVAPATGAAVVDVLISRVFYGGLLVMALYNAAIFISMRDKAQGIYVLFM